MHGNTATPIETEYGTVNVRRVHDVAVPEEKRPWTASYEVTGPRIKGLVHVEPCFAKERDEFELLPSEVQVTTSPASRYDSTSAYMTVNGVDLASGTCHRIAKPEDIQRFTFRRRTGDHTSEELSTAGRDRTRAALRAVLEVHFADVLLVHEHATAYARRVHDARTAYARKAIDELLAEQAETERRIEHYRQRLAFLGNFDELAAAMRPAAPEPTPKLRKIAEVKAGQRVTATGNDTRGYTVTRTGRLLAAPKRVTAQDWGTRVKKWRLYISDEPGAMPAHSNSVALPLEATVEVLNERVEPSG